MLKGNYYVAELELLCYVTEITKKRKETLVRMPLFDREERYSEHREHSYI